MRQEWFDPCGKNGFGGTTGRVLVSAPMRPGSCAAIAGGLSPTRTHGAVVPVASQSDFACLVHDGELQVGPGHCDDPVLVAHFLDGHGWVARRDGAQWNAVRGQDVRLADQLKGHVTRSAEPTEPVLPAPNHSCRTHRTCSSRTCSSRTRSSRTCSSRTRSYQSQSVPSSFRFTGR